MGVVPGPTPALRLELLWERRNVVVSGLEANSMYEVVMIASSLEARGQDTRMTVTTFANGELRMHTKREHHMIHR